VQQRFYENLLGQALKPRCPSAEDLIEEIDDLEGDIDDIEDALGVPDDDADEMDDEDDDESDDAEPEDFDSIEAAIEALADEIEELDDDIDVIEDFLELDADEVEDEIDDEEDEVDVSDSDNPITQVQALIAEVDGIEADIDEIEDALGLEDDDEDDDDDADDVDEEIPDFENLDDAIDALEDEIEELDDDIEEVAESLGIEEEDDEEDSINDESTIGEEEQEQQNGDAMYLRRSRRAFNSIARNKIKNLAGKCTTPEKNKKRKSIIKKEAPSKKQKAKNNSNVILEVEEDEETLKEKTISLALEKLKTRALEESQYEVPIGNDLWRNKALRAFSLSKRKFGWHEVNKNNDLFGYATFVNVGEDFPPLLAFLMGHSKRRVQTTCYGKKFYNNSLFGIHYETELAEKYGDMLWDIFSGSVAEELVKAQTEVRTTLWNGRVDFKAHLFDVNKQFGRGRPHVASSWDYICPAECRRSSAYPCVAIVPLGDAGCWVQIWKDAEIRRTKYDGHVTTYGTLVFLEVGELLLVRGDVVICHDYNTPTDDPNSRCNARAYIEFWEHQDIEPVAEISNYQTAEGNSFHNFCQNNLDIYDCDLMQQEDESEG